MPEEPPSPGGSAQAIPSGRRRRGGPALEAKLRRSETAAHALVRVLDRIFREESGQGRGGYVILVAVSHILSY
jgi:hypothetical protein